MRHMSVNPLPKCMLVRFPTCLIPGRYSILTCFYLYFFRLLLLSTTITTLRLPGLSKGCVDHIWHVCMWMGLYVHEQMDAERMRLTTVLCVMVYVNVSHFLRTHLDRVPRIDLFKPLNHTAVWVSGSVSLWFSLNAISILMTHVGSHLGV